MLFLNGRLYCCRVAGCKPVITRTNTGKEKNTKTRTKRDVKNGNFSPYSQQVDVHIKAHVREETEESIFDVMA